MSSNINFHVVLQKGMTPLILATKEKKDKIVKALLGAGVDVNLQTEDVSMIMQI